MPVAVKLLARTTLTTTSATLYTVPANTTTVVTNIVLANSTTSAATVTIQLDGVPVTGALPVAANATTVMDIRQVVGAAKTITAQASAGAAIGCHISGTEIT